MDGLTDETIGWCLQSATAWVWDMFCSRNEKKRLYELLVVHLGRAWKVRYCEIRTSFVQSMIDQNRRPHSSI